MISQCSIKRFRYIWTPTWEWEICCYSSSLVWGNTNIQTSQLIWQICRVENINYNWSIFLHFIGIEFKALLLKDFCKIVCHSEPVCPPYILIIFSYFLISPIIVRIWTILDHITHYHRIGWWLEDNVDHDIELLHWNLLICWLIYE